MHAIVCARERNHAQYIYVLMYHVCVYASVNVWLNRYNLCKYLCYRYTAMCTLSLYVPLRCTGMCVYVCVCVCVCACARTRVCACVRACVCVNITCAYIIILCTLYPMHAIIDV